MTDVGTIYGGALYDLAVSEHLSQEILQQLLVLKQSFMQEPEFIKLLSAYHLSKAERCDILEESFSGNVHPYVLSFLKILTEKGYASRFFDCCKVYCARYDQDHNRITVTAVTAVELTEKQTKQLTEKLEKLTEKTVALTNRVDPGVLGGVRLELDGQSMDDTLAHRLQSIRNLLNNTML